MFPELFELPLIHLTVKSYGFMMVLGFLAALVLVRAMACRIGENPDKITNAALYTLIAGVIGARLFYVIHNLDQFAAKPASIFAIWRGGLEFVGGIFLAVAVTLLYLHFQKLSIRRYLDILCVGLMLGLAFGRIGCLLNGCCFGKATDCPCAIHFPYGSPACYSQAFPNLARNRTEPQLPLPDEYYGYITPEGAWTAASPGDKYNAMLKPFDKLTDLQKKEVTTGLFKPLKVYPAQLCSSANAAFLCALLYLFWRKNAEKRPGQTLALMLILYGITRLLLEYLRDDNPLEYAWWIIYKGGTISQNIGIYMAIAGIILFFLCRKP